MKENTGAQEETSIHEDMTSVMQELTAQMPSDAGEVAPAAPAALSATAEPLGNAAEGTPPIVIAGAAAQDSTSEPVIGVALSADKAPSSWTPAMREKWGTLAQDFRQEIIRREQAAMDGVQRLHDQYKGASELANAVGQFGEYMDSLGVHNRAEAVSSVLATERALRVAPPAQKIQILMQLADDYGLQGFREVVERGMGTPAPLGAPQYAASAPPAVLAELADMRAWRSNFEQSAVVGEMDRFASDPSNEFFSDVRGRMADLFESGQAQTLKDAYDQAIWTTPAVREVLLSRQMTTQQAADLQTRQKMAGAASVPASGRLLAAGKESDDIDDLLREAWNAAARG